MTKALHKYGIIMIVTIMTIIITIITMIIIMQIIIIILIMIIITTFHGSFQSSSLECNSTYSLTQ